MKNSTEVRYLGDIGSYSYEIANDFINTLNTNTDLNSYPTISNLIKEESNYQISYLVVPLENTSSGNVYESYRMLYEENFEIIASKKLEVNNALILKKGYTIKDIKEVYSHPQALSQVSKFIEKNNLISVPDFSTVQAVKKVQESSKIIGAIASSYIIKHYPDLHASEININNNQENYTRFLICLKQNNDQAYQVCLKHQESCNIFIRFEFQKDRSGALNEVLDLLFSYNINLNKINSHILENKEFKYYFTVEGVNNKLSMADHVELSLKLKKITSRYCYCTY